MSVFNSTKNTVVTLAALLVSGHVTAEERHGAHVHGVAELTMAMEAGQLEIMLTSPAQSVVGFEYRAKTPEQVAAVDAAEAALRDADSLFRFSGTSCALSQAEVNVSGLLPAEQDAHGHEEHHDSDHHDDGHKDDTHEEEHHHDEHDDEHHHEDEHEHEDEHHHEDEHEHEDEHHHEDEHEHDDEQHHEDEHADAHEHDDEHHDEHHHDEHHEHDEEVHSDVTASYTYRCDDTNKLETMMVGSGKLPFAIETLQVMWVSESGQGATELTEDNLIVNFN